MGPGSGRLAARRASPAASSLRLTGGLPMRGVVSILVLVLAALIVLGYAAVTSLQT